MLEYAFTLYEKVLDGWLRKLVYITKMQYGFMPGTSMLCLFRDDSLKNLDLKTRSRFQVFHGLENTFNRVPREVICFALGQKGVAEYLENGVMALYHGCKTVFSVKGELPYSFSVKVGVHQGSAISPLLFVTVTDFSTEDVKYVSLMELLYADDLDLCGKSLDEVMAKYKGGRGY